MRGLKLIRTALLTLILAGAVAACADDPTAVEDPVYPQCYWVDGSLVCSPG